MHIVIVLLTAVSMGIVGIITSNLKEYAWITGICVFLMCVLLALSVLSTTFKKTEITNIEILKELPLPNQNVELFKENEMMKEIKIDNDFYTNIECKNKDDFHNLKITKKDYYNKWLFISYPKKEEIWVVLE